MTSCTPSESSQWDPLTTVSLSGTPVHWEFTEKGYDDRGVPHTEAALSIGTSPVQTISLGNEVGYCSAFTEGPQSTSVIYIECEWSINSDWKEPGKGWRLQKTGKSIVIEEREITPSSPLRTEDTSWKHKQTIEL